LARLSLALYLLASSLARFDIARLNSWETGVRLALAALIMSGDPWIYTFAIGAALTLLARSYSLRNPKSEV
jgi:hypothetical protein